MTLRERRVLFTSLVSSFLHSVSRWSWTYGKVEIAIDEWTIHSRREYIDDVTDEKRVGIDVVHHPNGLHPLGLAVDLLVYINDAYVTSGEHPIWRELDTIACSLDPLLRLGIPFHDPNHLSYGEVSDRLPRGSAGPGGSVAEDSSRGPHDPTA